MARNDLELKDYESGFSRFDSLMPFKVKDILLVSSLYDSFILEEDGQIGELIFSEYAQLNLSFAPNIKRVSTGEEALSLLQQRSFDLIIVFRRLGDIDIASFSRKAKRIIPDIPVVLLAFHGREIQVAFDRQYHKAIDRAFLWSGEASILMAIVKYIEDRANVDFDTSLVGVRVIIIIEDSVRFYSAYLPLIYSEIMRQTQNLMVEGVNLAHKLMRMRARPKILLADSYEEGWKLFEKYKKYLLGIISDIRFQKGGKLDNQAGVKLAAAAKAKIGDLPILLQSNDLEKKKLASQHQVDFLFKYSPSLLTELRSFIMNNFGFGDFVFRLADGSEVDRAVDFHSMEKCLKKVPDESLIYHGSKNHFSNWLMARTEFDLAKRLRPRTVSEFKDTDSLREYLIETFQSFRHETQLGIVTDFSRRQFDLQTDFVRIGEGSLGGKGRGLAFISRILQRYNVYPRFEGVHISVPSAAIIGTAVFDKFLEMNNLTGLALGRNSDREIARAFIGAKLPREIVNDLKAYLDVVTYPVAVRSSSLLEDSHYQPFAGIFDTHMLPNCHSSRKVRLERLEYAIKYIYASIFFDKAKSYIEATGNRVEEEKMGIIIQRVVGSRRQDSFYPILSGVARSYNFYSIGNIKPQEGVAYTALGLGKTIVEGGNCLLFSPRKPQHLPQFSTPKDFMKNSQQEFFAIDMSDADVYPEPGGDAGLVRHRIDQAERDGSLAYVGSTYSPNNDRVYEGTNREGIKIITFAPILKSRIFPLDEIIRFLLKLGHSAFNTPIEIEFAADLNSDKSRPHEFGFLQIRPMAADTFLEDVAIDKIRRERVFARSSEALSNGRITDLRDIIYVRPDTFDRAKMTEMAGHIGSFNSLFREKGEQYLLLGPGRWGTADRWLGIPATWDQISSARIIIEATYGDFSVTPSFGTHFFQNLVAFQIGYLNINNTNDRNFIDWEWLTAQPVVEETEYIRHVRLESPLEVIINGRNSQAVIRKP